MGELRWIIAAIFLVSLLFIVSVAAPHGAYYHRFQPTDIID